MTDSGPPRTSILDVKSSAFDVDAYLSYQLKQKTLDELVKEEEEMVNSVRRLDSDVHQLVYENYNKFLTATNTVRKIQDEFNELETEMSSLGSSMSTISTLIDELGGVLGGRKDNVSQLASSYRAVKSLQFIFDLPTTLQSYLDDRKYADLIRIYLLAKTSLEKYSDLDNVSNVCVKCEDIVRDAQTELRSRISGGRVDSADDVAQAVELLIQLGVKKEELQESFLSSANRSLQNDLDGLGVDAEDVLDLVDRGCGTFLPNMTLYANLHDKLFPDHSKVLLDCLKILMIEFHTTVRRLFLSSSDPKDCSIVVRALDRYYRKMSACSQVVPGLDFSSECIALISEVSRHQISISRAKIQEQVHHTIQELRETLLSDECDLSACVSKLEHSLVFNVKTALANLLLFSASDVTFSALPPSAFQSSFAIAVHENLLAASFDDLAKMSAKFADVGTETRFVSPLLLLLISVCLHHLAAKSALYLMRLCEEQFSLTENKMNNWDKLRAIVNMNNIPIKPAATKELTTTENVTSKLKDTAQAVLRRFAEQKGLSIGEGIAKAVEGASVFSSSPIGVRAAVRRAVEEVRDCDRILSTVLAGDNRKESRATRPSRPPTEPLQHDSLWSERVDFHQQIHFNRGSILSAVVRVILKTFVEVVRMHTYGKHSVEQIQVDCYYLQRNLAPLVSDEVVVNSLTDQALSSALKRSMDPVLVHPNKLMQICEESKEEE